MKEHFPCLFYQPTAKIPPIFKNVFSTWSQQLVLCGQWYHLCHLLTTRTNASASWMGPKERLCWDCCMNHYFKLNRTARLFFPAALSNESANQLIVGESFQSDPESSAAKQRESLHCFMSLFLGCNLTFRQELLVKIHTSLKRASSQSKYLVNQALGATPLSSQNFRHRRSIEHIPNYGTFTNNQLPLLKRKTKPNH